MSDNLFALRVSIDFCQIVNFYAKEKGDKFLETLSKLYLVEIERVIVQAKN